MLRVLIAGLCFLIAAECLALLAQQRTRVGIQRAARVELATWNAGHTPWDWTPRMPADAIAGRAFGNATLAAAGDGLAVVAGDARGYELGVPLARPSPLALLPSATLSTRATSPLTLQLSVTVESGSARVTSDPIEVAAGAHTTTIDLARLGWHWSGHAVPVAMPHQARELRLRVQAPVAARLVIRSIRWRGVGNRAPDRIDLPVIALATGASAEALLAQREHIHAARPAWLVATDLPLTPAAAASPPHDAVAWIALASWCVGLAILLTIRLSGRCGRWLAAAETVAVCAPPLAWAIGLARIDEAAVAMLVALAASVGYALLLAWRGYGPAWRWWPETARDAAWVALPVLVAVAWVATARGPIDWPAPRHVLAYLAWAACQQVLMLAVVASRAQRLLGHRYAAALATALLFALMHTPNDILMLLCLAAETFWAWRFLKTRAIAPIALAHALAALVLEAGIAGLPLRSLEIGGRFLL